MMIKSSLLLCVGLVSANLSFSQKAIVEKADLKNVTVFTNAAELSHTANINIPYLNSEIMCIHVANSIDENSIQIVTGANKNILSVRSALNYTNAAVNTKEYRKIRN